MSEKSPFKVNSLRNIPTFTVERKGGVLSGWTKFFADKSRAIEAQYYYVGGRCDYLRSEGFSDGSLGSDRQNACVKKNKKLKITNEFEKVRFYSIDKGYYSLKDLYGDLSLPNGTPVDRIQSIDRKLKDAPRSWIKRWCTSQICGCMGCINKSGKKYASLTKEEHEDYLFWLQLNAKDHEI